ncbi:MAG: hypothetical protein EA384_13105 [Spirochaetaceae bacterium]|nr:MAG: hypothetical protein EA384_13105 [Spirochaetaceae bacterium]
MELTQLAEGLVRIEKSGQPYLGIATYIPGNTFALTKLTAQAREDGWLVHNGQVSRWKVAGFTQHANRVYLYGDFVPSRSLAEILRLDWDHLLPYLIRMVRSLRTAERHGAEIGTLHTRSILFTDDGGVLFVPATVTRLISEQQSSSDRLEFSHIYTHPDRNDRQNLSFALAVICYRSLTGEFPYSAANEEELRDLMRARPPLEAWLRTPEIEPAVSEVLQRVLKPRQTQQAEKVEEVDSQSWLELLTQWRSKGVFRRLTDEQRLEIQARALTIERKTTRSYRRREYWRRNWKKVTAITLIVVLIGTVPGTMVRNWLQPRSTAGLPPREVVIAFYTAINNLDHATMEDAVIDGAGRDEIREVTNLFVMSRMRLAVEMTTGFIDAEQWRRDGDGTIPDGAVPYGVAGLQLQPRHEDQERAEFLVRYEKWMPGDTSQPEEPQEEDRPVAIGLRREDRVRLRTDRGDWVIYAIERLSESLIDQGTLQPLR